MLVWGSVYCETSQWFISVEEVFRELKTGLTCM